jgi:hypothetical protein
MSALEIQEVKTIFLKAGDEVLNPDSPQHLPKIAQALAAPNAVRGLARNGKADAVQFIKAGWEVSQPILPETAKQAPLPRTLTF